MSDPVSALPGASFQGHIRIDEAGLTGMVTIRADLQDNAVRTALTRAAGVDLPKPGEARISGERSLLWMSPDELLLVCPHAAAPVLARELGEALSGQAHLVADVSAARVAFDLSGDALRDVLAKVTPAIFARAPSARGRCAARNWVRWPGQSG